MDSINAFLAANLTGSGMGLWQMFLAIGLAYVGGVLSSLTPCVYPMIPITVSVVGGMRGEREPAGRLAWGNLWVRGLIYVAGMAVVYSFLGVLAGVSGKIFGSFTNTTGWYIALGVIFTVAALMMMDVLPFDPAAWWRGLKALWGGSSGTGAPATGNSELSWMGVFVLGATSGFIAAPCTTPVLASVLAYIAKTQSVGLGFVLMLAFSLGLGTLLLLIALFAGSLRVLPKSGAWLKTVKIGSGILLLVFAQYLFFRAGNLGG